VQTPPEYQPRIMDGLTPREDRFNIDLARAVVRLVSTLKFVMCTMSMN